MRYFVGFSIADCDGNQYQDENNNYHFDSLGEAITQCDIFNGKYHKPIEGAPYEPVLVYFEKIKENIS